MLADEHRDTLLRLAGWLKTKALFSLGIRPAAVDQLRTVYAMYSADEEAVVSEILGHVTDLVTMGAGEQELVDVFSGDKEKAETLHPLVVALRQHAGETVRASAEVLEVAADVRERLFGERSSRTASGPRPG